MRRPTKLDPETVLVALKVLRNSDDDDTFHLVMADTLNDHHPAMAPTARASPGSSTFTSSHDLDLNDERNVTLIP